MAIKDKVALITGAGSGVGETIAKSMARNGAIVVVHDADMTKASRVAKEITEEGNQASALSADVTNKEQVNEMFKTIKSTWGRIEILVNNEGFNKGSEFLNTTEDELNSVVSVNLIGTILCSQAAANYMKDQKFGRIINIASRLWLGDPGRAVYTATQGAIVSLTRSLAMELGKYEITVNCIAPGVIDTPEYQALSDEEKQDVLSKQPTQAVGKPEDVAYGVEFFADEDSSFIVGQVIYVCGGNSVLSSLSA